MNNLVIDYTIAFIATWLGAFAWWMICKGFNIPFSWNQYIEITWIVLIFKCFSNVIHSEKRKD